MEPNGSKYQKYGHGKMDIDYINKRFCFWIVTFGDCTN